MLQGRSQELEMGGGGAKLLGGWVQGKALVGGQGGKGPPPPPPPQRFKNL